MNSSRHLLIVIVGVLALLVLWLLTPWIVDAACDGYTVQRDDTLTRIAAHENGSVTDWASVNGLKNPNLIFVGQCLRRPEAKTPVSSPIPITAVNGGQDVARCANVFAGIDAVGWGGFVRRYVTAIVIDPVFSPDPTIAAHVDVGIGVVTMRYCTETYFSQYALVHEAAHVWLYRTGQVYSNGSGEYNAGLVAYRFSMDWEVAKSNRLVFKNCNPAVSCYMASLSGEH